MPTSKTSTIKWISIGIFIIGIILFFLAVLIILPKRETPRTPLSRPESPFPQSESLKKFEFIKDVKFISDIVPVFAKFCDELGNYEVAWALENPSNEILKIRLISQVPQYSQPKIDEVQLNPGETKLVKQCITFDEFKLKDITEKTKASLEFEAYANEKSIYQRSVPIWIHAWDDMIWSLNGQMDTIELIAAWVTPRNPSVMEVFSKAKEKLPDRSLIGCQIGIGEDRMKEELKAIYDTLCFDYRISYVSTPVSYAPGISQRVSLPSQTLKLGAANCIDGSVLFASLAEALGFNPEIIFIPGHAFVCVSCQSTAEKYCIETTLMKDCSSILFFQLSSFDSAVQKGNETWNQFFFGKSSCRPEEYTCIVSIQEARKKGITPLE